MTLIHTYIPDNDTIGVHGDGANDGDDIGDDAYDDARVNSIVTTIRIMINTLPLHRTSCPSMHRQHFITSSSNDDLS